MNLKNKGMLLMVLLAVIKCGTWQAYGNFTPDNITFIKQTIDKSLTIVSDSSVFEKGMPKNISDELNAAWSPAWYVVMVTITDPVKNAIVYGYSFRNHWFWYNNYDTNHTYIIWKDYNCHTWTTLDMILGSGTLNDTINANLKTYANNLISAMPSLGTDPWLFGFKIVTQAERQNPTHAYTIIVANNYWMGFNSRICMVNDGAQQYAYYNNQVVIGSNYYFLTYLLMRVR